jgi:hypothetical protein
MRDVMLDLETMGRAPRGVIASIGAALFNLRTGVRNDVFYRVVDIATSADAGLELNAETVKWWLCQSEEARQALFAGQIPLFKALQEFADWFPPKARIWGNGATFDVAILRSAYDALGYKVPWHYRQERDVRTLVTLFRDLHGEGESDPSQRFEGGANAHNALADAERQTEYCCQMFQILKSAADALKRSEELQS